MDINNQKLSTEEISKIISERDFYKKILDKIPAAIHVNNLNTKLVEWVNESAEKISGYKTEEIINNPDFLPETIVEDDIDWIEQSITDYKNLNDVYSAIYSMRHANGEIVTYHGLGVLFDFDEQGNPTRNLAIDINITHEVRNFKQLKKHLQELTIKLNQSKIDNLTTSEINIIKLLCHGKILKEIANELNRSPHTIDKHIRNIFIKLNIHKTRQLTLWAKEVGLV